VKTTNTFYLNLFSCGTPGFYGLETHKNRKIYDRRRVEKKNKVSQRERYRNVKEKRRKEAEKEQTGKCHSR
jgi:hypothetical protein